MYPAKYSMDLLPVVYDQLKFAVFFINTQNHNINMLTNFCVFTRMIETFQPAQVADMDHTTNTGSQFNKHTIRSNVLYQTFMIAAFREFGFNIVPWIRLKVV